MSRMRVKRPLRILIDMDDVLCDFDSYFIEKFRELYPNEPFIPLSERRTFYLRDQYGVEGKVRSIICAKGFFRNLPVIDKGIQMAKELSGLDNTEVYLCTSPMVPNRYCHGEKSDWVREEMGEDWVSKLIFAADKTMVAGDLLIDDKHRIRGTMKPQWDHILFSACHNLHLDLSQTTATRRLESWSDRATIYDIIEKKRKQLV